MQYLTPSITVSIFLCADFVFLIGALFIEGLGALSIIAWLEKHRRCSLEQISLYQQDWEIIKPGAALGVRTIINTA